MTREEVKRIKQELLQAVRTGDSTGGLSPFNAEWQAVSKMRHKYRMSVGYSHIDDNFQLELRIQSKGRSMDLAKKIKEIFNGEVNIEYIPDAEGDLHV